MSSKENKLLIPMFMGMSFRNFVQTGIIAKLSEKFEITFLVISNSALEKNIQELGYNTIGLKRSLAQKLLTRVFSPVEKIQYYSFYLTHKPETIKKYIKRDSKNFSFLCYFSLAWFINLFKSKFKFPSSFYRFFISPETISEMKSYDRILILSTDYVLDKAIHIAGSRIGKDISVMVHSWDNLPARGYIATIPDKLLVWNEVMVEQAEQLHGIKKEVVHIVGVPQFDFYKKIEDEINKELFEYIYGIAKDKKVITYTCSASRVFPDEERFIEELIKYAQDKDLNFVIRLHPTERSYYKQKFANQKNVILDIPSGIFAATVTENISNEIKDLRKFVSLMKYSDVVINLASTISLDAMIFDTCVVCPAYNPESANEKAWNNARDWYNSSHFKEIVDTGAVRLVSNKEDLYSSLDNYLSNPSLDKDSRRKIVERLCAPKVNSAEKIQEIIGQ